MLINSPLAIPAKKVIFPGRLPHKVKFIQINQWILQVWKDTYYKLCNGSFSLEVNMDYYFSYSNITHNCLDTSMLNDDITLKEIERVVAQAPSRKSCGPDNIYTDYFKNPKLSSIITLLFRLCFQSSIFPKVWHKAIILYTNT